MSLGTLTIIPKGFGAIIESADLVVFINEDKSFYLHKCRFETPGRVIDEKEFNDLLKYSSFPLVISESLLNRIKSVN